MQAESKNPSPDENGKYGEAAALTPSYNKPLTDSEKRNSRIISSPKKYAES
jgi:hypothetical protein